MFYDIDIFENFYFLEHFFFKSGPFFVSWLLVWDDLSVIFDQLSNLYLGFDAEPEIRILKLSNREALLQQTLVIFNFFLKLI